MPRANVTEVTIRLAVISKEFQSPSKLTNVRLARQKLASLNPENLAAIPQMRQITVIQGNDIRVDSIPATIRLMASAIGSVNQEILSPAVRIASPASSIACLSIRYGKGVPLMWDCVLKRA